MRRGFDRENDQDTLYLDPSQLWSLDVFNKAISYMPTIKKIVGGRFIVTDFDALLRQTRYEYHNSSFTVFLYSDDNIVLDGSNMPKFRGTIKISFFNNTKSKEKIDDALNIEASKFKLSEYFQRLWEIQYKIDTNINERYYSPMKNVKVLQNASQEAGCKLEINKSLNFS